MARLARHDMVARHGYGIGVAAAFGHSLVSSQRGSELGDGIARACHWLSYWLALASLLAGALCGLGMVLAWAAGMALGVALGMAWHSARHWLGVPLNSATQPGLMYTLTHTNSRRRLEARRRQPAAAWPLSPPAAASAAARRSAATPHRVAHRPRRSSRPVYLALGGGLGTSRVSFSTRYSVDSRFFRLIFRCVPPPSPNSTDV